MPILPVAGLFWRLAALIMDFLIIFLAINVVSRNFLQGVIALDRMYPYVTGIVTFLYFALLNGPVGKGRTVGKMAVGLVVTDFDGRPPTLAQSILRTVILYPAFVLAPIHETIFGRPESFQQAFVYQLIVGFPLIAVFLATLLVVPFNPFKQGLHDYPARTLVHKIPRDHAGERKSFEELCAMLGPEWPKFHRQPQMSGVVTFILVMALLGILFYPGRVADKNKKFIETLYALQTQEGFRNSDISLPYPADDYAKAELFGPFAEGEKPDLKALLTSDLPDTTGTLSLVVEVVQQGHWKIDLRSPNSKSRIDALATRYHDEAMPLLLDLHRESENPRFKAIAEEWAKKPMVLRFLFIEELISSPPIFRYRMPIGASSRAFPPMNVTQLQSGT